MTLYMGLFCARQLTYLIIKGQTERASMRNEGRMYASSTGNIFGNVNKG